MQGIIGNTHAFLKLHFPIKKWAGKFSAAGLAAAMSAGASMVAPAQAQNLTQITYLLPAPANAVAFAPLMIAQKKNYYEQEGLSVRFISVQGGADVGKQLAAGNGELGGGLGDTPIILRQNGIAVKGVALLGGRTLHQLMTREDRDIQSPTALKGKNLTVVAYQDTSFYAALAVLATGKLTRSDVEIQAVGPTGIWQQVAAGKADGMIGAPEMGMFAEEAGTKLTWKSTDAFFPGMAQAILASDKMIEQQPETVRKFVRATLKAVAEIKNDPVAATQDYIAAVPAYKDRSAFIQNVLTYYSKNVYPGQTMLGLFDQQRVESLQDFYFAQKIIRQKGKPEDFYTNRFVQ